MSAHPDEPSTRSRSPMARDAEDRLVEVSGDSPLARPRRRSIELPASTRASRSRRTRQQLEHLYEISKVLVRFESAEQTVPEVLGIASGAVPMELALVMLDVGSSGRPRVISWRAGGVSPTHLDAARAPGEAALAYFHDEMGARPGHGASPAARLVSEAKLAATGGGPQPIALPLVVAGGRAFGVVELESSAPLDEIDLVFVAAMVNQLAVALDRQAAVDARQAAAEASRAASQLAESLARRSQRRAERREAEAVHLRERYQALVDNLDHAFVWVADVDSLAVSYVSARVEDLLGEPVSAWEARRFLDHIHLDDRAHARAQLERVRREGGDLGFEARFVARDGSVRWFHTGVHLTASVGAQFQGVSVDVTDLKEASLQAIERFEFNRALTESMGEGVVAVDMEGRVTFLNDAGSSLLAWRAEDALGQGFAAVTGIQRAGGAPLTPGELPVDRVIASDTAIVCQEHLFVARNGSAFPVGYTAAPVRRDGVVVGAVLVFQNVLELQRSEKLQRFLSETGALLATSLDYRRTLASVVQSAVPLLADVCLIEELQDDGRIERVEILFADPRQQHLADRVRLFAPQADWATPGARALRSGESILVPVARPDELAHDEAHEAVLRECGVRSLMVVPLQARGKALGAITFVTTDSNRVYAPRDLALAEEVARRAAYAMENARLYESAQRAIRARDDVLAVVAHDLRGPLGNILMNAALLQQAPSGPSPAPRTRGIAAIERAAIGMKHLLGDLLNASAIEAGQLRLDLQPCDVGELLEEATDLHRADAVQRGLELVCQGARSDVEIVCDRDRVLQVLGNLIGNALKFAREGIIAIKAEQRGSDVVFSVSDQGSGIPAADLPHVFERYWQAGETARLGSGLGLSIVRGLVEAHRGQVWAESQPGSGSTFSFSIPLSPSTGPASAAS